MTSWRRGSIVAWCLLGAASRTVDGQETPPVHVAEEKWFVDTAVTVSPRTAPVPAFKYRLFPSWMERTEGNAVPIYLRFAHERSDASKRELMKKLDAWAALSPEKLPVAEARAFVDHWKYNLGQMDVAARKKTADWGYVMTVDPIEVLLPDVQEMRLHTRLLMVKARVEIAEGRYTDALRTLATAFSFARQIQEGPFLINGLVALAGASVAADAALDLVTRPDAPNLYWALTLLPRPLIDLRRELEFEQSILVLQFPDLADLDRPRSADDWDQTLARVRREMKRISDLSAEPGKPHPKSGTPDPTEPADRSPDLPEAKKYLVDMAGLPAAEVDRMPPARVLLRALVGRFNELRDHLFESAYLPYPQSIAVAAAADQRLKEARDNELNHPARLLLPAMQKALRVQARIDRKIAAQRVIEALRAFAAAHEGHLPERLEEIHEVPVPLDPGTGSPFEYHRDGDTATLTSRMAGDLTGISGLRYRVTMRK